MTPQPLPPLDPDPRFVVEPEPLTDPGTPWAGWILVAAFGAIGLLLGVAFQEPAGAVFGLAFLVGLGFVLAKVGR